MPLISRLGLSGYVNYAVGRVYFYGPVTGGFIAEPEHIEDAGRFLAPMDQTQTLAAGVTYRHSSSGLWAAVTTEYGSGTPTGHGSEGHEHTEGEEHAAPAGGEVGDRVPGHVTANVSLGLDVLRTSRGARLSVQLNVENVSNRVYKVAQESAFAAGEFSIPRLLSASLKVRF